MSLSAPALTPDLPESVFSRENARSAFEHAFDQHIDVAYKTKAALAEPFQKLLEQALEVIKRGNKILFFGNGGSAADAQHLATELTVRFSKNRMALPALALTTDSSALTAIGNDFGFDFLFSRQIEALGKAGDMVIAISTSGTSPNIIKGLCRAREMGLFTAAFGGRQGGEMVKHTDCILIVPSDITSHIQEMHITLGQIFCGAIEKQLGLV